MNAQDRLPIGTVVSPRPNSGRWSKDPPMWRGVIVSREEAAKARGCSIEAAISREEAYREYNWVKITHSSEPGGSIWERVNTVGWADTAPTRNLIVVSPLVLLAEIDD